MNTNKFSLTTITILLILMLTACGSAVSALSKQATNLLGSPVKAEAQATPISPTTKTAPTNDSALLAAYESALENIYQQVNPSVVNIRVVEQQTAQTTGDQQSPFFGIPGFPSLPGNPGDPGSQTPGFSQALGSGFVWDQEGHIVTNNHVVDGAEKIEVKFDDGTILSAELVGADSSSDLAVIKVESPSRELLPVKMADSDQVKVGQLAIAIGNPFGLENTMTVGIVSALGRTLPASDSSALGGSFSIPDIIQTDAPINPGNSGGVLVDDQGLVIGVTSAIESPVRANAGVGFAIPASIVLKVVPELIKSGRYEHSYLGISGTTLTPEFAKAMNLSANQRGALVVEVVSGGPADKADLRGSDRQVTIDGQNVLVGGDVITAIENSPINTMDDLISYLSSQTEVGQKVNLKVLRNGKEATIQVALEARPATAKP